MNKNKTLASQLINQIVEKDFVGAKDSFASLIRQKSLTRLGEKKIEVASRMFVSEARDTSPETLAKIKAADKSYSKMSTQELKKLYQQHYRVSDVSGMSKNNLIGDILRAEFGNKAVDMAFESVGEPSLNEAAKEMTMKQVMQKVNDGDWEAEQDIKVGKHIQFHDYRGKRFVIYVTEETELDEAAKEMTMKQVMQKVDDGEWEAEQDIKVGKHIMFHDHKGKRFVIYVTEETELDEAEQIIKPNDTVRIKASIYDPVGKKYAGKIGTVIRIKDNYVFVKIPRARSPEVEFRKNEVELVENIDENFLDEAKNKLSDLEPMEQFELINDYLGIRQYSGVKHFRTDPNRAEDIIKSNNVDADKVKDAIERMKKDKRLDRSFTLSEDADLLDEAYVDRFAKKRKENGSELKDWTMKKLDMFRDMPHGSYTNKEIQQEYQRRIKTGEYVKA